MNYPVTPKRNQYVTFTLDSIVNFFDTDDVSYYKPSKVDFLFSRMIRK